MDHLGRGGKRMSLPDRATPSNSGEEVALMGELGQILQE